MSELLLIGNPARRARRKSRKAPSAAQLRNRARFAAMARGRALPNPVKHRRRSRRVRRNPATSHAFRRPSGGNVLRGLMPMVKAAGLGGAGAIAADIGYGLAVPYLPAMLQTPVAEGGGINIAYYLGKGAFTVAAGVLAKKFLGAQAGQATEGALAVLAHDAMKQFVVGSGMAVPLGMVPGRRAARGGIGMYAPNGGALPAPGGNLGMYAGASSREAILR